MKKNPYKIQNMLKKSVLGGIGMNYSVEYHAFNQFYIILILEKSINCANHRHNVEIVTKWSRN